MKISELVDELESIKDKHGDIEIMFCGTFGSDPNLTVNRTTLLIE